MPTTLPISYDAAFEPRSWLSEEQWLLIALGGWAAVMLLVTILFQPDPALATADMLQLAGF
jgi:hypothetical protein